MFRVLSAFVLTLTGLASPSAFASPPIPEQEIISAMDSAVTAGAPGVIVYVSQGQNGRSFTRGLADPQTDLEMDPDFLVRMASVTKLYTGAVIVRMSIDGLIDLDDRAVDYLPGEMLEGIANGEVVTIRQLLNHTSGIPDYYDDYTEANWDWTLPLTEDRVLDYVRGISATAPAGERHQYSNTNYHLLSLIAQRVGRESLANLFERYLFDPAGLSRTSYNDLFAPLDQIHGMGTDTDAHLDTWDWQENTGPDGGLVAPAEEIALFLRALFSTNGELSEIGAEMLSDPVQVDDHNSYGFGVDILETGSGLIVGHAGSVWGYNTAAYYIVDHDAALVIHVNHNDAGYMGRVFRAVGRAVINADQAE